jgi:uncharacterized protein (DUF697 family)
VRETKVSPGSRGRRISDFNLEQVDSPLFVDTLRSLSMLTKRNLGLAEAAYHLATTVDRAADSAIHEEVAEIVKLHAKLAIASVWIPIPGADLAAMVANTWTMYARINNTLSISFSENLLKSIATGIGTNLLSNLPMLAMSSALKLIPGIGSLTGALVMSASIYTVTIAAGIVYMRVLASLLEQSSGFTEVDLKAAVDSAMRDVGALRHILHVAAEEYEAAKISGELEEPGN